MVQKMARLMLTSKKCVLLELLDDLSAALRVVRAS